MQKSKGVVSVLLIFSLLFVPLAGCGNGQGGDADAEQGVSQEQEQEDGAEPSALSYSEGISDTGYWEGITALDHVELFDYEEIPIPSSVHSITDERLRSEVNALLAAHSVDHEISDRAVEDGDTVNIDYVGSVDGVEFEGGTTNGAGTDVTIGVTSYIDDFLEQLIGHMPGETINVEVTFPENYGKEELNGKDALFVTTINYIVETVIPELGDDFVNETFSASNGWTTVEQMNQDIREDLQRDAVTSYIQEYMLENTTVNALPDPILSYVEKSLLRYYEENAGYYGMEVEEFLSMFEGVNSVDELLERYHSNNVEQGNYYLTIQAIAEATDTTVSDEDVGAYFAEQVGVDDYSQYEADFGMPYIKQVVLNRMILDYLVGNAVLEE